MSYTENNNFSGVNPEQSTMNQTASDRYNKLMLALAAVMGVIGSAAVGVSGSIDADSLYQMSSLAFPQLTAWLISYMMYQSSNAFQSLHLPSDGLKALPEPSPNEENA